MKEILDRFKFQDSFAVYVVTICFAMMFIISKGKIADVQLSSNIVEFLKIIVVTIITFHFGSSKGSVKKDETLSEVVKNHQ